MNRAPRRKVSVMVAAPAPPAGIVTVSGLPVVTTETALVAPFAVSVTRQPAPAGIPE
jgi:hypothetical protein